VFEIEGVMEEDREKPFPPTHLHIVVSTTDFTFPPCLLLRFLGRGGSGGWSDGEGRCVWGGGVLLLLRFLGRGGGGDFVVGCVRGNLIFWCAWRWLHTLTPVLVEEVDEVAALGALVDFRLGGHRDSQLGKV